jgi:CheY-like chemotaxis protein
VARFLPSGAPVLDGEGRAKPAVLVAESEPELRDVLGRVLGEAEYDIRFAADGVEAISAVARIAPDLLVLDLDLPRLDGLLALEVVRALSERLPIVLISSLPGPALGHAAERFEVFAVLRKPFRNAELLDAIARGLAARTVTKGVR